MQATEMCLAIDSPGQINANRICICKGSLSVFVTLKKKEKKRISGIHGLSRYRRISVLFVCGRRQSTGLKNITDTSERRCNGAG